MIITVILGIFKKLILNLFICYSTFRVLLHSLSRNCFKLIFFTNISIKVDIHVTVTNKLNNKIKQYCYENKRLKY